MSDQDNTDTGDGMAPEPEELVEMRRVLGAQLAAYRQAAELSQGQLAIAAMVDRTTVAHIEKGDPAPTRTLSRRLRGERRGTTMNRPAAPAAEGT